MRHEPTTTDPFAGSRRRRGTHASWWIWSLSIHALLFVLLWFSPARELVFEKNPDAQSQVSADRKRVEEVAGKIDEMQKELMLRKLERLDDIRYEMEEISFEREADFKKFARDLARDAPVTALEAMKEAVKEQEAALKPMAPMERTAQQMPALSGMAKMSKAEKMTNRERSALLKAEKQLESARKSLTSAKTAEQKARQALAALKKKRKPQPQEAQLKRAGQRHAEAKAKVAERGAKIKEAETARREASTAHSKARREAEGNLEAQYKELRATVSTAMEEARTHQREAQRREQEAAQKTGFTSLPEVTEALESALAKQAGADTALDKAQEAFAKTDGTRRKLGDARRKLASAQSRETDQQKRVISAADSRREKEEEELAKRQAVFEEAGKTYDETDAAHREAREAARKTRAQARTAQYDAREAANKAIAALRKAVASKSEIPLVETSQEFASNPPDPSELSSSDSAEHILETSGTMEEYISETYRTVKAIEEAAMRQVPVSEALKKTRIALPERKKPDLSALEREAKTSADVEARKEAYRAAQSQLSSAVSLAEQMLIQARGAEDERGMTIDYEGMKVAAARHQAYTQAALEESKAKAKDVSALMQGKEKETTSASAGNQKTSTASSYPEPPPSEVVKMPDGRRFTAQAGIATVGNQWVSVNDWYCIGPFPNPARREVDTRFPPDSVIDLDASYAGMGNRMVSWQYVKSPTLKVSPPDGQEYAIYYFYTELWFDEPMDLWLAVGSDDNLRIWIEEKMVWLSAYELKSWRIDEGFRKVHFHKGHNKILVRLENGWHSCDFSFLLHVGERK